MANLKSFDEGGLRSKITECREVAEQYAQQDGFETDTELNEFTDAITTAASAMLELVQRGHATPAQELAFYTFLQNNGVIE